MTQLAARIGVSDTYPLPSNATAKAALAAMWDVINEMSQAAEIDLASAATTNIGGQVSRKLRITGTTGITSLGTTYTGPIVLRFSGALTITHHATTLICPGGVNLTVAAGDVVIVTPKCTTSGTFDGWMIVARPDSQHAARNGSASEAFAASTLSSSANPKFSVHRFSLQSITAGVMTKAQLNTVDFDVGGMFDSVTNYRYTPTIAGYYQFSWSLGGGNNSNNLTLMRSELYKNGAIVVRGSEFHAPSGGSTTSTSTGSALIYMNGSTDYVELWGSADGTNPYFPANSNTNFLYGALIP